MAYLLVFLAFVMKHFFATNVLDSWYTDARDRYCRKWLVCLILQSVFEGSLSLLAYVFIQYQHAWRLVVLEMAILGLSCLAEHLPDYTKMIAVHFFAEISVLVLYGWMAYKVLAH